MDIPAPISPSDPNFTRSTLLGRLRRVETATSWGLFFEQYWKLIYSQATRAGLAHHEAMDVVQETVISLARLLPRFRYDRKKGSFRSLLCRITHRRVADQFRRRMPHAESVEVAASSTQECDNDLFPEVPDEFAAKWNEDWRKHMMDMAVLAVRQKVNSRQFQIFDLHVLQGWPVEKVTDILQVSRTMVYLAKHRILRLIQKEIQRLDRGDR